MLNSQLRKMKQDYRTKLIDEVILRYGGECKCELCGFNDLTKKIHGMRYLTMDKIDGGHNKLFREGKIGTGTGFYRWLRNNNYPEGYRPLCIPCNIAMEPNESICELHKWEKSQIQDNTVSSKESISWRDVFNINK
jgi:hypothetical protein